MNIFRKSKISKEEKRLIKLNKINIKKQRYISVNQAKRRIKNSQIFTNIKEVDEKAYIHLKDNKIAKMIEIEAIDLSLSSKQEKNNFFIMFKSLYQIKNLNMKCYKLDKKINLNSNKEYYEKKIEVEKNKSKYDLLVESRNLLDHLETQNFTSTSKYYLVFIEESKEKLDKQLKEIEIVFYNTIPKINYEIKHNRLEVYNIICDVFLANQRLDVLMWSKLINLIAPLKIKEKQASIKLDEEEIQMITIKSIPPFVEEQFLERMYNIPDVRCCISVKDSVNQDSLERWINSSFQFLLSDMSTTNNLGVKTELEIKRESFQQLMAEIKIGDEKVKEVSFVMLVSGNREQREEKINLIKNLAKEMQVKIDVPLLRQMEVFQNYDINTKSLKDYNFFLPTMTLSASFPFTKFSFKDNCGYVLGVDINTDLPIFYDQFTLNTRRTSHNLAIISSTGGGKSFTMKKMIVNEFSRGSKIFIFDAENEYKNLVLKNGGEYIDLYSKKGGIINPLQLRFIPSDEEEDKETDCPLPKHLGFLEGFFKTAFENITEKEIIILTKMIESLYNKFGIYQNTSINTLQSFKNTNYPTFKDLFNYIEEYKVLLKNKDEVKSINQIEILLSRFLTGTDSFLFDGYTTVDLSNDLIAFNLQELLYSGNQRLINTQTLNLLTFLNNNIVANKLTNDKLNIDDRKHICIIADEFHLFIDEHNFEVLRNFGQLARRIRKYSGALVVATQSVKDFVGSSSILRHATAIFNNCQYQMTGMLKEDDLRAYLELFKQNPLTDTQKKFLSNCNRGEFLFIIDSKNRLKMKIEATELEKIMMGEAKYE